MKTLFLLDPHSMIDMITNSSSELFVNEFENSIDEIKKLLNSIYPNYLDEYEELKTTQDLSISELDIYLSYAISSSLKYDSYGKDYINRFFNGFFDIKDVIEYDDKYDYSFLKNDFVKNNFEKIKKAIDPENKKIYLFSKEENPNWDKQEILEEYFTRYHLG